MRRLWIRAFMVLVGVAVFTIYAVAAAGYLLLTWLFAEPPDLLTALAIVFVFTVVAASLSYRFGTARLLSSLQVVELPHQRSPALYRRLDRLAMEMDIDRPPILIAELGVPNALSLLTLDELEGILAHELAHMESYDTFVQTLAVSLMRTFAGLLTLLG